MVERRPPGFNVPIEFYDGAEVNSIPKRIRAAAIGVWALAGNYSATKLFDGYVGPEMLKLFGCTPAIRAALQSTINAKGELSPLWVEARNGGVQLTNWPKWQRTNDEVTTYRGSEAERKRNERKAKRNGSTSVNAEMSGRTSNGHLPDVQLDHGTPQTETKTETKNTGHLSSDLQVSSEPPPRPRSLTFTEMAGGTERRLTPPPPDPGPHSLAARALVKRIIPDTYPATERGKLIHLAAQLLGQGTPEDLVEAALALWLTKPHAGAGLLPSLVSEVIKTRAPTSRPMGTASTKAQGILDAGARLAERMRTAETQQPKEIEGP